MLITKVINTLSILYVYKLHIHDTGAEHQVKFVTCSCEPLAITMVRAHLWPATPQNARIAFSFRFLDLTEAMLLECQVALKDLCKAISYMHQYPIYKVTWKHNAKDMS